MNFQELLKELNGLDFRDLIDLYIEANLGYYTDTEPLLGSQLIEYIDSLGEDIGAAIKRAKDTDEPT